MIENGKGVKEKMKKAEEGLSKLVHDGLEEVKKARGTPEERKERREKFKEWSEKFFDVGEHREKPEGKRVKRVMLGEREELCVYLPITLVFGVDYLKKKEKEKVKKVV